MEILEETPLIGEFVAEGGVTDDVVVMWDEVLDPRFMPDPADFTVTINTVPSDPTAVDLLFSGLARSDFEFGADGISFMQLDLPAGVTYGANDTVTISYTPTVTPVRDLALNESTGFPDTAVTAVEISGIFHLISVVDSYHGADKLVLSLTEPVEPSSLPALSQFTVDVGGTPVGVLGVDDLSPDVGMALIELTLDLSEVTISQSSIVTFDYAGSETTLVGEFSGQPLETLNDVQAELFIANNAAAAPDSLAGQELTTATPEGPTAADPVATTIVPAADGFVSISESTVEAEPPSGYEFFGHQVEITMPDAPSPEEPNVLTFVLDASIIPAGQDEMSIQLFRDGVLVPDCMGDPGVADPTPCISERVALDDGDISLTALTVQASSWNLGVVRPFEFGGFLAPVDGEVPHIARAGRAIPVRFSLGGDQGLDIFVDGSPSSQSISCDSVDDGDVVEETVTVGNSSLTYDAETDTYSYVWKTRSEWADTCRRLVLDFADGSTWTAVFDFRR